MVVVAVVAPVSVLGWIAWASANHLFPYCAIGIYDQTHTRMNVGNLTRASDIIIIGTVLEVGPSRGTSTGIVTPVAVNASQILKGAQATGRQFSLLTLGGTIGCYQVSYSAEPSFKRGEDLLLFLRAASDGSLRVTNGIDGKYTITDGTATSLSAGAMPLQDLVDEINRKL